MGQKNRKFLKLLIQAMDARYKGKLLANNLLIDAITIARGLPSKIDGSKETQLYGLKQEDVMEKYNIDTPKVNKLVSKYINKKVIKTIEYKICDKAEDKDYERKFKFEFEYDKKTSKKKTEKDRESVKSSSSSKRKKGKKKKKHGGRKIYRTVEISVKREVKRDYIHKRNSTVTRKYSIDECVGECNCSKKGDCSHIQIAMLSLTKPKWMDYYLIFERSVINLLWKFGGPSIIGLIFDKPRFTPASKAAEQEKRDKVSKSANWEENINEDLPVWNYTKCTDNRKFRYEVIYFFLTMMAKRAVHILGPFYDDRSGIGPLIIVNGADKNNDDNVHKIYLQKRDPNEVEKPEFEYNKETDKYTFKRVDYDKSLIKPSTIKGVFAKQKEIKKHEIYKAMHIIDTIEEEVTYSGEGEVTLLAYVKALHKNLRSGDKCKTVLVSTDTDLIVEASKFVKLFSIRDGLYVMLNNRWDKHILTGQKYVIDICLLNMLLDEKMQRYSPFAVLTFWWCMTMGGNDYTPPYLCISPYAWIVPFLNSPILFEYLKLTASKKKPSPQEMKTMFSQLLNKNNTNTITFNINNLNAVGDVVSIDKNNNLCYDTQAIRKVAALVLNSTKAYKQLKSEDPYSIITSFDPVKFTMSYNKRAVVKRNRDEIIEKDCDTHYLAKTRVNIQTFSYGLLEHMNTKGNYKLVPEWTERRYGSSLYGFFHAKDKKKKGGNENTTPRVQVSKYICKINETDPFIRVQLPEKIVLRFWRTCNRINKY